MDEKNKIEIHTALNYFANTLQQLHIMVLTLSALIEKDAKDMEESKQRLKKYLKKKMDDNDFHVATAMIDVFECEIRESSVDSFLNKIKELRRKKHAKTQRKIKGPINSSSNGNG